MALGNHVIRLIHDLSRTFMCGTCLHSAFVLVSSKHSCGPDLPTTSAGGIFSPRYFGLTEYEKESTAVLYSCPGRHPEFQLLFVVHVQSSCSSILFVRK